MLNTLYKIYRFIIFFLGNATLIILVAYWGTCIYKHFKMKKVVKEYGEKLHKSNFINDALGKMTDEEKAKMKEKKSATSTVTLNFGDMSVKKETK